MYLSPYENSHTALRFNKTMKFTTTQKVPSSNYAYLKVLDAVAVSPNNQRSIAKHADLSLGMVNLILKRFIQMGYIRIKNLNGRRLNYLLTPKGMYEKSRQSCHYIQRILSAFTELR